MKSFLLMLTFMTRIPIPIRFEIKDNDFKKGVNYMPLMGLIIGVPMALFIYYSQGIDEEIRAVILIGIYLVTVGGIHLDGLADYCDGIFSGQRGERIFKIMSDSHIGTFGVMGLGLYCIIMFVGFKYISWQGVLFMPIVARTMAIFICAFGQYPKEKGMGHAIVSYTKPIQGVIAVALLLVGIGWVQPILIISTLIVFAFTILFLMRTSKILGGITGDVIGAIIELSQAVWLITIMLI